MSYVAPSIQATGDLITAAIWNQNVVNNMIAVQSPAIAVVQPSNPTGTSSASDVMMGLGSSFKITTSATGRVIVMISGVRQCTSATAQNFMQLTVGTGTAPTNGSVSTGSVICAQKQFYTDTASAGYDFQLVGSSSGFTIGTQFWLDVFIHTNAGTMSLIDLTCIAIEV